MVFTTGILQGKERTYWDLNPLLWQNPTKTTNDSVRSQSPWGVRFIEGHLDLEQKTEARASDAPTAMSFEEYPTSPIGPINTYLFHDDDSDSVSSRVRDRRAALTMYTNTSSVDSNSQDSINGSENDDETTVRRPSAKACESEAPTTLFQGPLDDLNLRSDNSEALDKPGMSVLCPIKIKDDSDNDSSLAYLTNQEITSILLYGKKSSWANSHGGSKLGESARANGGKKITSDLSFHDVGKVESADLRLREHASTPSKTVSLVSQLRTAAVERGRGRSYGDRLVKRDKTRISSSLSSMSETIPENLEYSMRPSIESLNDDKILKTPKRVTMATPLIDRKRVFVFSATPDLMSSMIDYVDSTYELFDENLTEDGCWLHPFPPAPQFDQSKRSIARTFTWMDGHDSQRLTVNFAIVVLLLRNRLTEVQKQGYVENRWQTSRICGNWTCCNWDHFAIEPKEVSNSRMSCCKFSKPCRHNPRCLKDKKCYPPSSRAITHTRTDPGHQSPSHAISLARARDKFRIQKSSISKRAFRRLEQKPLSSPSLPTRYATSERSFASPSSLSSTRSVSLDNCFQSTDERALPDQFCSPQSSLLIQKSCTPLPQRANPGSNVYVPETPRASTTTNPTTNPQQNSSPHDPSRHFLKSSILSKTLEMFHPAARNLRSSFRAVALLLAYQCDAQNKSGS